MQIVFKVSHRNCSNCKLLEDLYVKEELRTHLFKGWLRLATAKVGQSPRGISEHRQFRVVGELGQQRHQGTVLSTRSLHFGESPATLPKAHTACKSVQTEHFTVSKRKPE